MYTQIYMRAHMHTLTRAFTFRHIQMQTHAPTHTHTCTNTHTQTHIFVHGALLMMGGSMMFVCVPKELALLLGPNQQPTAAGY